MEREEEKKERRQSCRCT